MPATILLCYANDPQRSLQQLENECNNIQLYLDRVQNSDYDIRMIPRATPELLIGNLNNLGNEVEIFHYSGHANGNELATNDQKVDGVHLASLLAERCPNLKLVFLNGCDTEGQVKHYLDKKIPYVVGTNAPVRDDVASKIAINFYLHLSLGRTIKAGFEAARNDADVLKFGANLNSRGLVVDQFTPQTTSGKNWNLYYAANALEYALPLQAAARETLNTDLFAQAQKAATQAEEMNTNGMLVEALEKLVKELSSQNIYLKQIRESALVNLANANNNERDYKRGLLRHSDYTMSKNRNSYNLTSYVSEIKEIVAQRKGEGY